MVLVQGSCKKDESWEQQVLPSENAGLNKAQLNQVLQAMQVTQARPRDIRLATFSPKDVSETVQTRANVRS